MLAPAPAAEPCFDKPLCPVCGELTGHHVFTDATSSRDIFKCDQCTAVFVAPPVEQVFEEVPASYVKMDISESDEQSIDFWFTYVRSRTRRKAFDTQNSGGDGREVRITRPSILDVGCGPGHLLARFKTNGWDVRGIDPWTAAAAASRDHYQISIEPARLENVKVEPKSQDVVISIDVLQFVGKPRTFLDACKSALKPGGLIFLTVPNFGSAESRREGWKWQMFLPCCYVNYFTETSLRRLLENSSLVGIEITPFGGPDNDAHLRVEARRPDKELTWADISEDVADQELPVLDRRSIDVASLSAEQRSWREDGYIIVKRLIPDELIDRYCA